MAFYPLNSNLKNDLSILSAKFTNGITVTHTYNITEKGRYLIEGSFRTQGSSDSVLSGIIKKNGTVISNPYANNYPTATTGNLAYKLASILDCDEGDVLTIGVVSGGNNYNFLFSSLSKFV